MSIQKREKNIEQYIQTISRNKHQRKEKKRKEKRTESIYILQEEEIRSDRTISVP